MNEVNVVLWFDVEDYITPESDEALIAILKILNVLSIPGVFKLVGEKVRRLLERDRQDIVDLLKKHDIGFHTDLHSHHPTVSEYVEPLGFREGALKFEAVEGSGLDILRSEVSHQVTCYGQAGYSWAPQAYPVLRRWGVPLYLDDHDVVRLDGKPFWYGGLLNLTSLDATFRMELTENGLEAARSEFDKIYEELEEDGGFVSIFYHPCEFATQEFWDACNFANGSNTDADSWRIPLLRTVSEMEYYLDKFRRFLTYIKSKKGVRFVNARDIVAMESSKRGALNPEIVKKLVGTVESELGFTVLDGQSFSASDIFVVLYEHCLGKPFQNGVLYGPEVNVASTVSGRVPVWEILESIKSAEYRKICDDRQLPDYFSVADGFVNPVDMACTLAYITAEGLSANDEVEIVKGRLKSTDYVRTNIEWGDQWVIFPKKFETRNIVSHARNQSWTLKPASFD